MRKSYSLDNQTFVDKFKKTNCYSELTSRILSASRGGEYYGPAEGQYTSHWHYQPKKKCKCINKELCEAISKDLYVAASKSSCYIQDHATAWFNQQQQMKKLKQTLDSMSTKQLKDFQCQYHGKFPFQSPTAGCLDLKKPIRSVPCVPFKISNAKQISPEFLQLLRQHDARQRERSILYCLPKEYTARRLTSKHRIRDGDNAPANEKRKTNKECLERQEKWSLRGLRYFARSQARMIKHENRQTSEQCSQDTYPFIYQQQEVKSTKAKSSMELKKPKELGFLRQGNTPVAFHNVRSANNLRSILHLTRSSDTLKEVWAKPQTIQLRESRTSLRPKNSCL
uniref:Uncharacterized protein n=1 Tax=Stomoxys calcitrans TaxID=35570 RepID=A0A1I8P781_STOCA